MHNFRRQPIELAYPVAELRYRDILDFVRILERHGCLICPSDTCYGVMAVSTDSAAVRLVHDLTGRRDDPLPVTVGTVRAAAQLIDLMEVHEAFIDIAWPGAFTAVARCRRKGRLVSSRVNGRDNTLGVRVTSDSVEAALANELGVPIISTAVRHPNGRPVRIGAEARRVVSGAMTLRGTREELVGFTTRDTFRYRTHSTVGRMTDDDQLVHVLREGVYSAAAVERLLRIAIKRAWGDPGTLEDVT